MRSIVAAVKRNMPVGSIAEKRRFGLQESLKDVLRRLSNASVVGLVGMGGIGKTTLALEIYNHLVSHGQFQHHCFLKDVRSSVPFELQRQLLHDLNQDDLQRHSRDGYERGFEAFSRQRVLIVIDDIDKAEQFRNLIPDLRQLESGSRVVVTSRHRDVLNYSMRGARLQDIYEVRVLNGIDSRRLFNWHAFHCETASEGFGDLAEKVVHSCAGHPWALEVIGASLFDKKEPKDVEIWKEAAKSLKENEDILGKIRSSYDGPSERDKAMFRDIACMMIGMREDRAMAIWKSCDSCSPRFCSTSKTPVSVLRRLVDKSLVRVEDGRLSMHDVLRDMGRDAVMRASPDGTTHLWDMATAAKVLSREKETMSVRGMLLSTWDSDSTVSFVASRFANMKELHLLVLDGCDIVHDDFSNWSKEIRWLQWRSLRDGLPSGLSLSKLTILDLSNNGCLRRLWTDDSHIKFPCLQFLILTNCRKLEELPANIGQSLPGLTSLEMGGCSEIVVLPYSIVDLENLKVLMAHGCSNLNQLPDGFWLHSKLEELDLSTGVKELQRSLLVPDLLTRWSLDLLTPLRVNT